MRFTGSWQKLLSYFVINFNDRFNDLRLNISYSLRIFSIEISHKLGKNGVDGISIKLVVVDYVEVPD